MADKKKEEQQTSKPKAVRTVQKYTDQALAAAKAMPKETWQRIKHYSKVEMVTFIQSVYNRGFREGQEAARKEYEAAVKEALAEPAKQNTDSGGAAIEND